MATSAVLSYYSSSKKSWAVLVGLVLMLLVAIPGNIICIYAFQLCINIENALLDFILFRRLPSNSSLKLIMKSNMLQSMHKMIQFDRYIA